MDKLVPYQAEFEQHIRIAYLIAQFIQEDISEEEEYELESWMLTSERNVLIFEDVTDEDHVAEFLQWYATVDTERSLKVMKQRIKFKSSRTVLFWRYAAAASIIALLGLGTYLLWPREIPGKPPIEIVSNADIAPGGLSATLTLANGQKINLNHIQDTNINSSVHIEHGIAVYTNAGTEPEENEISIPRKGFYQLVLPDGSKVWINSSSSIRYPTRFTGKERRVSVTGETYFEVAKDHAHPFIVHVNGVDITAVGTAFNINAYENEAGMKITLTEGKINIDDATQHAAMEPGQQIFVRGGQWQFMQADASTVTAWTKNQFKLKNTKIEEVMRMAERWYDAQVIYEDQITDHFTGTIDRNVPISHLLKLLAATGQVHFRIAADSIIVTR
jgi:transmembrane sensor